MIGYQSVNEKLGTLLKATHEMPLVPRYHWVMQRWHIVCQL